MADGVAGPDAPNKEIHHGADDVDQLIGDIFHQEFRVRANGVQEGLTRAGVGDHLNCVPVSGA